MTAQTRKLDGQPIRNRFLPILNWLPNYQRKWLRGDILAGLTVLALLIPEGMAYAEIVGMPPRLPFTPRQLVCCYTPSLAPHGILLGNNNDVPAYRWWDRVNKQIVMSGDPRDAIALEAKLSTWRGLLSDGGASRGNMFSGDAAESLLTMSTVLNKSRGRGPGFYFYLFSPYVIFRLVARFIVECLIEWKDAWRQKRRKDPYRVSARNPAYALLQAFGHLADRKRKLRKSIIVPVLNS